MLFALEALCNQAVIAKWVYLVISSPSRSTIAFFTAILFPAKQPSQALARRTTAELRAERLSTAACIPDSEAAAAITERCLRKCGVFASLKEELARCDKLLSIGRPDGSH